MSEQEQPEIQNGSENMQFSVPAPLGIPAPGLHPDQQRGHSKRTSSKTSVRLLNIDSFDGKLIVLEIDTGKVYLVNSYEIKYAMRPQEIEKSILAASERPYDWSEEISALGVDPVSAQIALATDGLIRKDDADEAKLKRRLTVRGVIRPEGNNG